MSTFWYQIALLASASTHLFTIKNHLLYGIVDFVPWILGRNSKKRRPSIFEDSDGESNLGKPWQHVVCKEVSDAIALQLIGWFSFNLLAYSSFLSIDPNPSLAEQQNEYQRYNALVCIYVGRYVQWIFYEALVTRSFANAVYGIAIAVGISGLTYYQKGIFSAVVLAGICGEVSYFFTHVEKMALALKLPTCNVGRLLVHFVESFLALTFAVCLPSYICVWIYERHFDVSWFEKIDTSIIFFFFYVTLILTTNVIHFFGALIRFWDSLCAIAKNSREKSTKHITSKDINSYGLKYTI